MTTTPYEIVNLSQDERGVWSALIECGGRVVIASRRNGSWSLLDGEREIQPLPHLAADLADHVRRIERQRGEEITTRKVART